MRLHRNPWYYNCTTSCSSRQFAGLVFGVDIYVVTSVKTLRDAGATNPPKPGTRHENVNDSKEAQNLHSCPFVARWGQVGSKCLVLLFGKVLSQALKIAVLASSGCAWQRDDTHCQCGGRGPVNELARLAERRKD